MRRALANPTYRRLFCAQVVALAGTGLATVALGLLAYDLAGGDAGVVLGTALALKMVAYVLVAPVATAVLARVHRRTVLVGADLVRLAAAAALPWVGDVWQVYLLVVVLQAASATFTPVFQSVVPDVLADEDDYTAALSLSRLAYDLEAVLAPVLAAALLLVVPFGSLFAGTAVGFAGSALLVAATVVPRVAPPGGAERPRGHVGRAVRRGTGLFVRVPALRPVLALDLAVAAAGAVVLVQTVVLVRSVLGRGDGTVALVLAVHGAGSMAAAVTLPPLLRRVGDRAVMLSGACVLTVATALLPLALRAGGPRTALLAVAGLWVAVGAGWSAVETPVGRMLRRHVPAPDLPAAFAAHFSLSHAFWLLTYPAVGWLGLAGLDVVALTMAAVAAVATAAGTLLWPRARPTTAPTVQVPVQVRP
ncbi:MFS transporter [Cellulomonas phragmiteti]|uniref:MFS transporter n=1 Tax=Cellulomonas phragmiteti TaxID=478780 RepID=A0ABQ4DQF8_9CELL|nr:MFS transporter [Cellulomonas phragmiteti]GIG41574.1 MFS transporter [Cellulomonas phragmiteti]